MIAETTGHSNPSGAKGTVLDVSRYRRVRFNSDNPGHLPGTIAEIILTERPGETTVTAIHSGFASQA